MFTIRIFDNRNNLMSTIIANDHADALEAAISNTPSGWSWIISEE